MEVNIALEIEKPKVDTDPAIEEERNKLSKKVNELTKKLEEVEGENERLKRQIHSAPPSGQKDHMEKMKDELERNKIENKILSDELEARKEYCSRMETENFEQKMRISHWRHKAEEKIRENVRLSHEVKSLFEERESIQNLVDENIKLNGMLSRHNIDPNSGIKFMANGTNQMKLVQKVHINPYVQIHMIGDGPVKSSLRTSKSFEDVRPDSSDSIAINLDKPRRESNVHSYVGLHRSRKNSRHFYEFH